MLRLRLAAAAALREDPRAEPGRPSSSLSSGVVLDGDMKEYRVVASGWVNKGIVVVSWYTKQEEECVRVVSCAEWLVCAGRIYWKRERQKWRGRRRLYRTARVQDLYTD